MTGKVEGGEGTIIHMNILWNFLHGDADGHVMDVVTEVAMVPGTGVPRVVTSICAADAGEPARNSCTVDSGHSVGYIWIS